MSVRQIPDEDLKSYVARFKVECCRYPIATKVRLCGHSLMVLKTSDLTVLQESSQRHIDGVELLEAQALSKKRMTSSRKDNGKSTNRSASIIKEYDPSRSETKSDRPPRFGKYTPTYISVPQILAWVDKRR